MIFIDIVAGILLIFLILTFLGLLNPKIVLKRNRLHVIKRLGLSSVVLFIVFSCLIHFLKIL